MRDPHLQALVRDHMALRFPPGLRGEEIDGVDLVMLDADTYGVASQYERNSRPVTPEHVQLLDKLIGDVDRILPLLPAAEAKTYFASVRALGNYLLGSRVIRQR
jgi:hypothetical protein